MSETPYILYIPDIAIEKIFSYLPYDTLAKNRVVCRKFNDVGGRLLSRSFSQLDKRHFSIFKRFKSMLPRRESERRAHHLARHCDILQAIETRISMLNMTYMKYIESNLICFIPGKVLDEITKVLNMVESNEKPPRTHEILQELRDLSSMAMEHFDEHVLPRVKEAKEKFSMRHQPSSSFSSSFNLSSSSRGTLRHQNDLQKVKHHIASINYSTQKLLQKIQRQNARIKAQTLKIREQDRRIQKQSAKIQEQEGAIADIKKHMDEWDQKYKDLTAELIRTKEDLLLKPQTIVNTATSGLIASGSAASVSSGVVASTSGLISTSTKLFKSAIIKPRKAQIRRNYPHVTLDLERKRRTNLLPEIPLKRMRDDDTNNRLNKLLSANKKDVGIANKIEANCKKSNLSFLYDSLIMQPLSNIKSRKRKIAEDIDLK